MAIPTGSINLTPTQIAEALAVLVQNIQPPFPYASMTGLHWAGSNSLVIDDIPTNQLLAAQLNASTSVNAAGITVINLSLVTGQPSSGE
jgi:hypothetical protein